MRNHPFDEGGTPLSQREEQILRRLDAELGPMPAVPAPDVATRPWRVWALLVAVVGLTGGTVLILIGVAVPGSLGRVTALSGLGLFAVSVQRALSYRLGLRGTRRGTGPSS